MKKLFAAAVLFTMALAFAACGGDEEDQSEDAYVQYYDENFRDNANGTVEIVNATEHDILLFEGENLSQNFIVGGVRAKASGKVNFSAKSDFDVGGYVLLQAVKQSEFAPNAANLKTGWKKLVQYCEGKVFTADIHSMADGKYQYIVSNRSASFGMELRKNSFQGETIAYLSAGEINRFIYSDNSDDITLYPVWLAYNNATQSIVSFYPTGLSCVVTVIPRLPPDISSYYFPLDENMVIDINFEFAIP